MYIKKLTIIMVLTCLLIVGGVSAQNMSISNLDLVSKQNVLIYTSNGTLIGTYNTSSNIIPLPAQDFNLILKPNAISRFSNPVLFLTDIVAALETYWLQIFMILGGVLLAGALANKGRR